MTRRGRIFRNILACAIIAAVTVSGAFVVKDRVSVVEPVPFTDAIGGAGSLLPYDSGSSVSGILVSGAAKRADITRAAAEPNTGENDEADEAEGAEAGSGANAADAGNSGSGNSGAGNGGSGSSGGAKNGSGTPGGIPDAAESEVSGVYFTTSIEDGATVYEREYRFTVTHERRDLKVREVIVSVNGGALSQWNGAIELSEGANAIRVTAVYADEDGREIAVYRDYTLNAALGEIYISSSLAELPNATAYEPVLEFTAYAKYGGQAIPLAVECGGTQLQGSDGNYTANLKEGANLIALSASMGAKSKAVSYEIAYAKPGELIIVTDLQSDSQADPQVINGEELSFSASVSGGAGKARLNVVCDGVTLVGSAGNYRAKIEKLNRAVTVRIKATESVGGETLTATAYYYVKYVPIATEETAPYLKHVNVTDGMTVTGAKYTLDIAPVNHEGKSLGYNNVDVSLNDAIVKYSWMNEYLSYALTLEGGANTLKIRLTDDEGRHGDYSYVINCNKLNDGDSLGKITISVDAAVLGLGYLIAPTEMEIFEGEMGSHIVDRLLKEHGFTYKNTGTFDSNFYLARVVKSGVGKGVDIPEDLLEELDKDGYAMNDSRSDDSIGEKDYFKGSGWMYSKNGSFPGHGFADAVLKDGDAVKIRFTLAYGKDIGGYKSTGGDEEGNYGNIW